MTLEKVSAWRLSVQLRNTFVIAYKGMYLSVILFSGANGSLYEKTR